MTDHSKFKKGVKVCRRYDPGRRGYLTGRSLDKADDVYHQVDFQDNTMEYVPEYELEVVNTENPDPFDLIRQRLFGKVSDLRRNLSHIQLSGKLSSLVYSLDTTNTEFFPHQFKPVLAFLESPSRGLLIADEVGLGKTIEAGLIWTELRARYDDRRVLVVCPAMLREKWRDELRDRFGIDATIMKADELLAELKRPLNQIPDGKGIICSIQGIRSPSDRQLNKGQPGPRHELARFLNEQSDNTPIIDLVIIDEAHYLRNRESQNAHLGKLLRDVSKHVVLLSATPINLKSDDLFNLLNIVDPDTFDVPDFFPQVLQANEPLVRARELVLDTSVKTKSIQQCLDKAARHDLLRNSLQLQRIREMLKDPKHVADITGRVYLADMIDRVNLLRHVVNRTRKAEVFELKVVREPKSQFVEFSGNGVEKKFYEDVTDAIRSYAQQRGVNDGFLLANPQRQVSSCMYAAAKSWIEKGYEENARIYEEMLYEYMGAEFETAKGMSPLMEHLAAEVLPSVNLNQLREHDSKFNNFCDLIKTYFKENLREKIVVFSYFRATLHYLEERLTEQGIASQVLMGGMKESKQDIIHQFHKDRSMKVLLSSEVASEGVDLQFCRMIVNYDLPWNPMKIEQRIGRLDRIGQTAEKIIIWNLGYANTIDQRIYEKLFERLRIFERALGGMEAILGEEIKNLTDILISHRLTPEEEESRISQTAIAIENNQREEERLEQDASSLIAHGGYILNRVKKAYDLKKGITDVDLSIYVKDYLEKYSPGHEFYQPETGRLLFDIKLPASTTAELEGYIRRKNLHGQTRLATGDRIRCEFINKTNSASRTVEQISQFHPLVRFISTNVNVGAFPVVAVKLQYQTKKSSLQLPDLPDGQYVFAIQKWKFSGLHNEEDMRVRAMHIESTLELDADDSWKLINAARLDGSDWPEATTEISPSLEDKVLDCYVYLDKEFNIVNEAKQTENKDRVNFQIHSAKRHRDRQLAVQQRVLENYRNRNQTQMIPATEGRIRKIESRFDKQIETLKNKASMSCKKKWICCGALLLK